MTTIHLSNPYKSLFEDGNYPFKVTGYKDCYGQILNDAEIVQMLQNEVSRDISNAIRNNHGYNGLKGKISKLHKSGKVMSSSTLSNMLNEGNLKRLPKKQAKELAQALEISLASLRGEIVDGEDITILDDVIIDNVEVARDRAHIIINRLSPKELLIVVKMLNGLNVG